MPTCRRALRNGRDARLALGPFHRGLTTILLVLALIAPVARAETPAAVVNPRVESGSWVSDGAALLSPATRSELDALVGQLEIRNGAEIAVVTIHDAGDRTPRQFATELFHLWGIGKKGRDNGVLVLIVAEPHRIEVETGYGAEAQLPDGRIGRILDREVIPRFKAGDWDGGTLAGVSEFARALREDPPAPLPLASRPASAASDAPLVLGLLALAVLLGSGGWYVQWKRVTRYCTTCGRKMRLLDESADDPFLDAPQRFEEELHSMNHLVWRCDACATLHLEHREIWFSGYTTCPRCHHRTVAHRSTVIRPATYDTSGEREVTEKCSLPGCAHESRHRETIPRLEHASSSSYSSSSSSFSGGGGSSGGSSFGGGSSGGGGSGRSW